MHALPEEADVVIVGAEPVGLAMGIALAHYGVDTPRGGACCCRRTLRRIRSLHFGAKVGINRFRCCCAALPTSRPRS
jgi:hypothetical protein